MDAAWDVDEAELRTTAAELRVGLGLDISLSALGDVSLVGAGALRVMVARDLDITVAVPALSASLVRAVGFLAASLSANARVREVLIRNDAGRWNLDPRYPDGVYVRIDAAGSDGELWSIDIWFVDEPDRQPDLQHLKTLAPRIDPTIQSKILSIKRAQRWTMPDGSRMPSVEIYLAVLDDGVSNSDEFRMHMGNRVRQDAP